VEFIKIKDSDFRLLLGKVPLIANTSSVDICSCAQDCTCDAECQLATTGSNKTLSELKTRSKTKPQI